MVFQFSLITAMPSVMATGIPDFLSLPMKFCKGNSSFSLYGSTCAAVQEWQRNQAWHQILTVLRVVLFLPGTPGLCLSRLVLGQKLSCALSFECIWEHADYLCTAIQALTYCTSSSHCHPSHPPLWWHLIAVIAWLGMPQILLKNVTVSVTTWENIPNANWALAAYKTIAELHFRIALGFRTRPGLPIYVDALQNSPCFHWNQWKSWHRE